MREVSRIVRVLRARKFYDLSLSLALSATQIYKCTSECGDPVCGFRVTKKRKKFVIREN